LLRPLYWIDGTEAQGHATIFIAKFFGHASLMSFLIAVPEPQRLGRPAMADSTMAGRLHLNVVAASTTPGAPPHRVPPSDVTAASTTLLHRAASCAENTCYKCMFQMFSEI
jgi:hypothetical protein